MRTAVFHGNGVIAIETFPDPEPGPDEVVIKVARCGVCGSDVSMTAGSDYDYPLGTLMGHEIAGEIVALGRDVGGMRVGDRVTCLPNTNCGLCEACRYGSPLLCSAQFKHGGGFGDYVVPKARSVAVLPQSLSLADGALVEPMACGLRALRRCEMRAGDEIVVLGAGAMALSIIFWARRLGAGHIAVVARSAAREDLALAFGAHTFHSLEREDLADVAASRGRSPDIVVECVGKGGFIETAVNLVRTGGKVVSLGMCLHQEPFVAARYALKEVSFHFPLGYSPEEFFETARIFDAGDFRPEIMVSGTIPLDDLPAMIERMRTGQSTVKIQVVP